ncbi:hypothetical protein [Saccharicrinis sp. GN24d3]|uniref:hypothetical protein n=1 Tax=Saccharicrinis sp. GN24d3 TaxID=3458416 RepID=UPI0040374587
MSWNCIIRSSICFMIGNAVISVTCGTYKVVGVTSINMANTVTSTGTIFLGKLWDLTEVQENGADPPSVSVSVSNFVWE